MSRVAVIIPCGKAKLARPAQACQLYTGSLFKANLTWALSVVALRDIYILSAKYGLVISAKVLEPYDVFMGDPGCIDAATVKAQAQELGLHEQRVYGLGGEKYRAVMRAALPAVCFPMPSVGMGYQMQLLKKNRGVLPHWRPAA